MSRPPKLTADQVMVLNQELRKRETKDETALTNRAMADQFNVCVRTIGRAIKRIQSNKPA